MNALVFSFSKITQSTRKRLQYLPAVILTVFLSTLFLIRCGPAPASPTPVPVSLPEELLFFTDADHYTSGEGEIRLVVENRTGNDVYLPICGPWTIYRIMGANRVVVWEMNCREDYLSFKLQAGQSVVGVISLVDTASSPYYLDAMKGNYRAELTVYSNCSVHDLEWVEAGSKYGELDDCSSSIRLSSQIFSITDPAGRLGSEQSSPITPEPKPQVATGLRLVAQTGGVVSAIAWQQGLIVAGVGSRLEILNALDLTPVGRVALLPSLVTDIELDGDMAFLALGKGGLMVVDISDPQLPDAAGLFQSAATVDNVAVNDQLAWIAAGSDGFLILDVSNLKDPIVINQIKTGHPAIDVALYENLAFLLDGASLIILDTGNPTSPEVLSELKLGDQGSRILISDDRAFIAFKESGVRVVDFKDIKAISEIAVVPTLKGAMGLAVAGQTLLVADYTAGLSLIDTVSMTVTGNLDTPGIAMNVVASENHAWVADFSGGIRQFDLRDIANPNSELPIYQTAGWINSISIDQDNIAIAGTAGLGLLDNHNLAGFPDKSFKFIQRQGSDWASKDVELKDGRAYCIDDISGLQIFDITSDPVELAALYVTRPRALTVENQIVYLANNIGLVIIDASVLPPVQIQSIVNEWNPSQILVAGRTLYIADQDQGVWVYDVSNPARPVRTGNWDRPAKGLALGQNLLVSAAGSKGLRTAAIGDPQRPIEIGRWITEDARAVAVVDQVAYLVDMVTGVHVIGLQNPSEPIQLGILDTPGSSVDIASDGEYVYVADSAGGLLIYLRE